MLPCVCVSCCLCLCVCVCVFVCVCVCVCVCVSKWWICEKARTQKLLTKALKGVRWMCSSFPEWERLTSVECTRSACINNINNDNSEGEILRTPHTGSRFPKCRTGRRLMPSLNTCSTGSAEEVLCTSRVPFCIAQSSKRRKQHEA